MRRQPIEKLIPYLNRNVSNSWYPEVPYGVSFDGQFIELMEFSGDDRIFITCNGTTRSHPAKVQEQFSVWKLELIE